MRLVCGLGEVGMQLKDDAGHLMEGSLVDEGAGGVERWRLIFPHFNYYIEFKSIIYSLLHFRKDKHQKQNPHLSFAKADCISCLCPESIQIDFISEDPFSGCEFANSRTTWQPNKAYSSPTTKYL